MPRRPGPPAARAVRYSYPHQWLTGSTHKRQHWLVVGFQIGGDDLGHGFIMSRHRHPAGLLDWECGQPLGITQQLDPAKIPDPLAPENLLKTSGRGIFLIRSFMDDVQINPSQAGTEIKLFKHVHGAPAGGKEASQ